MPTRSGLNYHVRYSIVDSRVCTYNGCNHDICECQPCPICAERKPKEYLHVKNYTGYNNIWLGPHCPMCDFLHWCACYYN